MESASAKTRSKLPHEEAAELAAADAERAAATRTSEEIVDGLDDLLDEIDAVLEEQSVLANFRQKGGQ